MGDLALLAVMQAIRHVGGKPVLPFLQTLGDDRDLLADLADRLGVALFGLADPHFKPIGDADDFLADVLGERDLARGHLREALLDGLGQFARLIARCGAVIVARLHGAQAALHGFVEALDLDRDRFDRLRMAPLGRGDAL